MNISKASSQTGYGNYQSVYCGGFLNNNAAATTDAKIKGKIEIFNSIGGSMLKITLIDYLFWFLDCTSPFEVNVVTDATTDVVAATIASSNVGKTQNIWVC